MGGRTKTNRVAKGRKSQGQKRDILVICPNRQRCEARELSESQTKNDREGKKKFTYRDICYGNIPENTLRL